MRKQLGNQAIKIFEEYQRIENRMPTKKEWDYEYYGREMRRGESNYYYTVKKKWLAGCEA